jgi:DNA polymerase III epsilon subunit-like protein
MEEDTVYISVDIEANGPCPTKHSILSIGAVALQEPFEVLGDFYVNLETGIGRNSDPETMLWWQKHPEAYEYTQQNRATPVEGLAQFASWLESYPKRVFVAYPTGYDFSYLYTYFHSYLGHCPFGYQALDMQSFAAGLLRLPYLEAGKRAWPDEWWANPKYAHRADADALEQGFAFLHMLAAAKV